MGQSFVLQLGVATAMNVGPIMRGFGKIRAAAQAIHGPANLTVTRLGAVGGAAAATGGALNVISAGAHAAVMGVQVLGNSFVKLGRTLSMGSIVLGLFGASIVSTGMMWNKSWNAARAITAGTVEEMKQLENLVRQLAGTTKYTAIEIADAVRFLGMAGNTATEQFALLPATLDLAAAAGIEVARTADIMTNIQKSLNLPLETTGLMADYLTAAFTNSNVTLEHLGQSMKKMGPVAAELKIDMAEVMAVLGALGNAGIQGEMAATHLRTGLVNISKASGATGKAMARMGLTMADLDVANIGLRKTLENLGASLAEVNSEQERFGLMADLFGKRAVSTWSAAIRTVSTDFAELEEVVRRSEGATQRVADIQLENIKWVYQLKAAWENFKISLNDILFPLLEKVGNYFLKLHRQFQNVSLETRRLYVAFGIFITLIGPALVAVGLMIRTVANLIFFINGLKNSIFLLMHPIALIAGAFLGLGYNIAKFALNGEGSFNDIAYSADELRGKVFEVFNALAGFLKNVFERDFESAVYYIIDLVAILGEVIGRIGTASANVLIATMQKLLPKLSENWTMISDMIMSFFTWLTTTTEGGMVAFALIFMTPLRHIAVFVAMQMAFIANTVRKALWWIVKKYALPLLGQLWNLFKFTFTGIARSVLKGMRFMVDRYGYILVGWINRSLQFVFVYAKNFLYQIELMGKALWRNKKKIYNKVLQLSVAFFNSIGQIVYAIRGVTMVVLEEMHRHWRTYWKKLGNFAGKAMKAFHGAQVKAYNYLVDLHDKFSITIKHLANKLNDARLAVQKKANDALKKMMEWYMIKQKAAIVKFNQLIAKVRNFWNEKVLGMMKKFYLRSAAIAKAGWKRIKTIAAATWTAISMGMKKATPLLAGVLKGVFLVLKGIAMAGWFVLANPLSWVILAIVGAGGMLYAFKDEIVNLFKGIWRVIEYVTVEGANVLIGAFNWAFKKILEFGKPIVRQFMVWGKTLTGGLFVNQDDIDAFDALGRDAETGEYKDLIHKTTQEYESIGDAFSDDGKVDIIGDFAERGKEVFNSLKDTAGDIFEGITTTLETVALTVGRTFMGGVDAIGGFVDKLKGSNDLIEDVNLDLLSDSDIDNWHAGFDYMMDDIKALGDELSGLSDTEIEEFKSAVDGIKTNLTDIEMAEIQGASFFGPLTSHLEDFDLVKTFEDIWDDIKAKGGGILDAAEEFVPMIFEAIGSLDNLVMDNILKPFGDLLWEQLKQVDNIAEDVIEEVAKVLGPLVTDVALWVGDKGLDAAVGIAEAELQAALAGIGTTLAKFDTKIKDMELLDYETNSIFDTIQSIFSEAGISNAADFADRQAEGATAVTTFTASLKKWIEEFFSKNSATTKNVENLEDKLLDLGNALDETVNNTQSLIPGSGSTPTDYVSEDDILGDGGVDTRSTALSGSLSDLTILHKIYIDGVEMRDFIIDTIIDANRRGEASRLLHTHAE